MGIEQYLTVKDIDKVLEKINDYKVRSLTRPYPNFGLCWMFSQIQPAILEEKINPIINLLLEIDGIKVDSDLDWVEDFVHEWGEDQSVRPQKWYCRRIGALLKARDILTKQTYEYYV